MIPTSIFRPQITLKTTVSQKNLQYNSEKRGGQKEEHLFSNIWDAFMRKRLTQHILKRWKQALGGEKSTDWGKDDAQDKLPTLQHCLNYHWYPKKHSSSLELPRCPGLRESTLLIFSTTCLFFFFFFLTWEPSHPAASQLNASDCSMVLFWRKSSGLEDQIESQKWRLSSSWWVYNWE